MKLVYRYLAAGLVLLAAACGPGGEEQPAGLISHDKFVAANVALRLLPPEATPEQRRAVLARHHVSEAQLEAWVQAHGRRPEQLAFAWEEIAAKLDSLASRDPRASLPPPPGVDTVAPVIEVKDSMVAPPSAGEPPAPPSAGRPRRPRPTTTVQ